MNAEAIMTPGGIADQLTRGLSGLGQSFNRREELLRQGQRDRIGDDRYTAEMALRERDHRQQIDRQEMMDQRDANRYSDGQTRQSARDALETSRYGAQQKSAGDALARQKTLDERSNNQWYLSHGAVPEGVDEYKNTSPQEAFGRFGPNDPPEGYGEGSREYTPEGRVAYGAREVLSARAQPRGRSMEDQLTLDDNKAANYLGNGIKLKETPQVAPANPNADVPRITTQLKLLNAQEDSLNKARYQVDEGSPEEARINAQIAEIGRQRDALGKQLAGAGDPQAGPPRSGGDALSNILADPRFK